jgi:hypothetical protein
MSAVIVKRYELQHRIEKKEARRRVVAPDGRPPRDFRRTKFRECRSAVGVPSCSAIMVIGPVGGQYAGERDGALSAGFIAIEHQSHSVEVVREQIGRQRREGQGRRQRKDVRR